MSAFLRGILASKEEKRAQQQADELSRMREIEARRSAFNLARDEQAYKALVKQYGPVAGDPQSLSMLQGAEQDRQAFPLQQRAQELALNEAERTSLEGATLNALVGAKSQMEKGQPVGEYLRNLPPRFREVYGLDDDTIGQYESMFQNNPEALDAMIASLSPQRQGRTGSLPKPFEAVDAEGNPVFLQQNEDGTGFVPLEGFTPPQDDSGGGSYAPIVRDGVVYYRPKGGAVYTQDMTGMAQRAGMGQTYAETYGRETAELDAAAGEGQEGRLAALANISRAGGTVVRDADTALQIMRQDNSFRGTGTAAAASRLAQSRIPGTNEYDVKALLDSMKANIGIDSLLNIKREGAGLGQVPQSQLETLQSLLGNMNVGRDPRLLRRDVQEVVDLYDDIVAAADGEIARLQSAPRRQRGNPATQAPARSDSSGLTDEELDAKYGLGGN